MGSPARREPVRGLKADASWEVVLTDRAMTGFHRDDVGDWVAELECGHNQHVRHSPPFQWREWVLDADARARRIGSPLPCPLCDRAELPEAVRPVRSVSWDEATMPAGLLRAHRLGPGTWGRLRVRSGRMHFHASSAPPIDVELGPGSEQAIPPGVEHQVRNEGPVQFSLEFLTVDRAARGAEAGGDPACWAGLVCPECGGVRGDGTGHRPGCSAGASRATITGVPRS